MSFLYQLFPTDTNQDITVFIITLFIFICFVGFHAFVPIYQIFNRKNTSKQSKVVSVRLVVFMNVIVGFGNTFSDAPFDDGFFATFIPMYNFLCIGTLLAILKSDPNHHNLLPNEQASLKEFAFCFILLLVVFLVSDLALGNSWLGTVSICIFYVSSVNYYVLRLFKRFRII